MKDFKNIGIVGAGSMGIGIAQIASTSGCKVFLYDQNVEIAQSALNKLKNGMKFYQILKLLVL